MLIFTFSLSQSTGLASHPLSATLLCWARGRIWKKDKLCMFAKRRVIPLSALLQSICWARKAHAKPIFTNVRWAGHSCTKRMSTNKATYLSLKSDLEREFWPFFLGISCMSLVLEREVQIPESLRDFVLARSTETRARKGNRPESVSWVCEWLRGPTGGGDIPTTCISVIFHLSLFFVVKEASQLWRAKSSVCSSL